MSASRRAGGPRIQLSPRAWTLAVFCLAAVAGIWRRAGTFHAASLDFDESVYVVIARRWLEGDLPYAAIYDIHPVGLPALLAAAIWVLDDGLLAARLTAALVVASTCTALFVAGARFTRSRATGAVAALLYGVYMLRAEALVPNTELFNNLLVTLAASLLFGQAEMIRIGCGLRRTHALAAAALLGAGLQVKYVVFPEAAGFCLAFLVYWRRNGAAMPDVLRLATGLVAAGLAPTLAVVTYFWFHGALEPFLDANIRANLAYVAVVPGLDEALYHSMLGFKPFAFLAVGAAALAVALRRHPRLATTDMRNLLRCCTLWLFLSAVNVVLPLKFFNHYFYALLPPLCLMAAAAVVSIGALNPRLGTPAMILATLLLAAPPLRALARELAAAPDPLSRATELTTACIREHPSSRPGLYVFNWDPILYETTRTRPPTRYVLPGELSHFSESAGVDPMAEIARILAGRPGHIVVSRPSYFAFSPAAAALVERTVAGYELACAVPFRVNEVRTAHALVYRLP